MSPNTDLTDRTILLVNTGTKKKEFILKKLKNLGLKIVALNTEKNWADPYVDHWILENTNNENLCIKALNNFIKTHPKVKIDGILSFWEASITLTAKLAEEFQFIGIPYKSVVIGRDKYEFRSFCRSVGIPSPKHYLLSCEKDLNKALKVLHFPLVAKPLLGSSSAFVVKVNNKEELLQTYDYIRRDLPSFPDAHEWGKLDQVLLEEYIDGDEVDMDILLQNGKIKFYSISDNHATNEPYFVETGQAIPSSLPGDDKKALIDMAEETLEKMGIQNGCMHFEAKISKKGPVPIEVNLRMGGDEVYTFIKDAWGVDLIEYSVKIALGIYIKKIYKPKRPLTYLSGKYFLTDASGIVVKLDITRNIHESKTIGQLYCAKKVGDTVLVPPEGYDFLGWATAKGDNPLDAEDNLNKIINNVKYEVVKFDASSALGKTKRASSLSTAHLTKSFLKGAARIETIKNIDEKNLKNLKLGLLCNFSQSSQDPINKNIVDTAKTIQQTLTNLGYQIQVYDINYLQKTLTDLQFNSIDLIFNIARKLHDLDNMEPNIAAICQSLQLPYTGSNHLTLALCGNKILAKKLMTFHKIPTPKWDYAHSPDDHIDSSLKYPLIVKPSNTDKSVGVTNESIVKNEKELRNQLEIVISTGKAALIEEYIEMDEYDVSIIGNGNHLQILPLTRSVFKNVRKKDWNIYSYERKWLKGLKKSPIQIERPPKKISKKLESLLTEIGFDVYRIFNCHDYGRVEIKVDKQGNPYVLELNANPSLNPNNFFASSAKSAGITYKQLIEKIIATAVTRYKSKILPRHLISKHAE